MAEISGADPSGKHNENTRHEGVNSFIVSWIFKLLIAALLLLAVLWMLDRAILYVTSKSYIDEIAYVFDLNRHLAEALTLVLFTALLFAGRYAFSWDLRRRRIGIAIVSALLVGNSLVLWWGTRGQSFTRGNIATKCYVITRTAIKFGEHPGTDPASGEECVPVTPAIAEQINAYAGGKRPVAVTSDDPTFFDRATGWPVVWYVIGAGGEVQLFDLMGFDPQSGQTLKAITPKIVADWREQRDLRLREKQKLSRAAPQRIEAAERSFFDPLTGKPKVWYWRDPTDGHFEFFDGEGFDPINGQVLAAVTPDIISEWTKWTKEASKSQSSGNKKPPQKIDPANYAFFDPVTGKPRVWYWRGPDGEYEFYDAEGFHQFIGQPLSIITPEVVTDWNRHQAEKAKERTELEARERQHAQEQALEKQRAETERQRIIEEARQKEAERVARQASEEEARRVAERLAEAERLRAQEDAKQKEAERAAQQAREEEARRVTEQRRQEELAQAGSRCDANAANPMDQAKASDAPGVKFDVLRADNSAAVESCRAAAEASPGNLRYKYQLARALAAQQSTEKEAMRSFAELAARGYAAAFDNLGWLSIKLSKDYARAASLFRQGVRLGDPDCMVSLATLIEGAYAQAMNASENKWALLSRAAELGHPGAQFAVRSEQERQAAEAQKRLQEQQQRDQALQLMGTFLQAIPRQ